MTISEPIGKFKTELKNTFGLGFTRREVNLDIIWVSCGCYIITGEYVEPLTEKDNKYIVPPVDFSLMLTPEWLVKSVELFPADPNPRMECYKPYYEDYETDQGMFDMGYDNLFRAYRDPHEERAILTSHTFVCGVPANRMNVLSLKYEELKRLKEYLDNPNGNGSEIFYSGCQIAGNLLDDLRESLPKDGGLI